MLIGLVGKPSVGKSTFFKSATLAEVEIASYPFTTIKSNSGVGYVKIECIDKEFDTKCNPSHGFCLEDSKENKNYRFVPVEIMDVAGLVPGASEGRGLGNQFLDDLRKADVFIVLVDLSGKTNAEGKIVEEGNYDPGYDIEFLEEELNKWYYNILKKVWKAFSRKIEISKSDSSFADAVANQFSGLKVNSDQVKEVLRKIDFKEKPSFWNEEQLKKFASLLRKKSKPMIIAANKIDLPSSEENYEKLKSKFPDLEIIPCSADSELALREAAKANLIEYIPGHRKFNISNPEKLDEKQKNALDKIKNNILDKYEYGTGVQKVLNQAVLSLLEYIAVFPASANRLTDSKGNVLPDCFLMKKNSTALDFAYRVHEDFGKNFVKAIDARTKKILSKDYLLKHRDAIEIMKK